MQAKLTKGMLMTALLCGAVSVADAAVLQEFTLDTFVVTATRYEKKDIEIPASVEVISRDKVEKNGGASAYEVLRNSLGLSLTSQGPNGASLGSMTSEASIRGVKRGTLVLLDGMPLNQDGKYNLEDIPAEIIERIEIVRSGGSVLYGSESTGGVINIITRSNERKINKVKLTVGDYGRETYNLTVGDKDFNAVAYYENRGNVDRFTTNAKSGRGSSKVLKYLEYDGGDRKGIRWHYDINDKLTFLHQYSENTNVVNHINPEGAYNKGLVQVSDYKDIDNSFNLNFDDKNGLKAHLSYGTQEKEYDKAVWQKNGSLSSSGLYSWRKGHNTNFDINKIFQLADNKLLIGASYKKEDMDIFGSKIGTSSGNGAAQYVRDTYSLYASYDMALSAEENLIVNMRETFAENCKAEYATFKSMQKDMKEFTPEVQYIKRITEDSSVYAKAGKSFRLPDLTRIYGSGNIKPTLDLYPEKGTHYEIGYKLNESNKEWRISLFNFKIKDSITKVEGTTALEGNLEYKNSDFKNTGIEVACGIKHDDFLSSSLGVSWSDPKQKNDDGIYEKYSNGLQFNASIDYNREKLSAALMANYLGERYSEHGDGKLKPALYTDLHISYQPEKNQKVFLHVNNLFNRDDYSTNALPTDTRMAYLTMGRNFIVGYEYSF